MPTEVSVLKPEAAQQIVADAQTAQSLAEAARDQSQGFAQASDNARAASVVAQGLAEAAATNAQASARTVATWAVLETLTGSVEGEGAEVLDSDTGTHLAATATGYDGSSVNNAGRYSWNATWERWVRIGATGLGGKASIASLDAEISGARQYTGAEISSVRRDVGLDGGAAIYTGDGPVFPFALDETGRVLLGYDESADKIIGAGLDDAAMGQGLPLVPLAEPIAVVELNHVIAYGQSNSVGAQGKPVLSAAQPYSNVTFQGGPRAYDGTDASFSPLKPLVEDENAAPDGLSTRGETLCSGMANYATTLRALDGLTPADHIILASAAGRGGSSITQIKNGTSWYINRFRPHIQEAHAINSDHAIQAIAYHQGESDGSMSRDDYLAELVNLRTQIELTAQADTGQTTPVFWLLYQTVANAATSGTVQRAQLDFVKDNQYAFLATPTYHLPHDADEIHLTNVGHKWAGAYGGKAYATLAAGFQPQWLDPVSATLRGTTLRVRFSVPFGPLVIDRTNLAVTTDDGFVVTDSEGAVGITSVSVDGDDIVIELDATPSGSTTVRYALDNLGAGLAITNGASGNVRDSDPRTITIDGIARPLYNVAPHFELPIVALGE